LQEGKVIEFQREGKNIIRNNVKWTTEEIEIARNSENQGLSIKQIAKRLGRSYASTYQKLKKVMK
jgi:DNA-binding NarL/FixJ family response regulator